MVRRILFVGLALLAGVATLPAWPAAAAGYATHTVALVPAGEAEAGQVTADFTPAAVTFWVDQPGAALYRLRIAEPGGNWFRDSGVTPLSRLEWDWRDETGALRNSGLFQFELQAWADGGQALAGLAGLIDLDPAGGEGPTLAPLSYNVTGNFTVSGNIGVGTENPARAVHIQGANAVFRMDRSADTAAFMLVRTDTAGNPIKTFVVGVNASGSNNGTFVINDLGTATSGAGANRLTIANDGAAAFGGEVRATGFFSTSSARYKEHLRPLEDALGMVLRLQGVSFTWIGTGAPGIGLVAEEVAQVVPEAVAFLDGQAEGVDYGLLTAVLVEAAKTQQAQLDRLEAECRSLRAELARELAGTGKRKD